MAKLILSLDGMVLREIDLEKERTTIGRKPHNDVHIDNLAVSGEHAVVVRVANDCFLEDLGSTNGTLINGKPVKKQFLQNNDVIELGKYKLKYFGASQPPAGASEDYEQTMVWRPATIKTPAEGAAAGHAAASSPATPATPAPPASRQAPIGATGPASAPAQVRTAPPPPAAPPTRAASASPTTNPTQTDPPRTGAPAAPSPSHSPPSPAAAPRAAAHPSAPRATHAPPGPSASLSPIASEPPPPTISPLWKTVLIIAVVVLIAIIVWRMKG